MSSPRFLQLSDVSEVLNISAAQTYALVRSGELPAIKIGGRGQWRVEVNELEAYIQRLYSETRQFVEEHPFGGRIDALDDSDAAVYPPDQAGEPPSLGQTRSRSA